MKIIKRLIKTIIFFAIIAGLAYSGLVVYTGYGMYKDAMAEKSLETRVEELQSQIDYIFTPQIAPIFMDAVVAVEDRNYYEHGPVSIKSIGRAMKANIKEKSFVEGGSTITQQTAKNLCFTQDKKLSRKVAEVFVAFDLEKAYSKDEILEMYVNLSYYGDGFTGIKQASMGYFGKIPLELNLDESSLLAGLLQAPSAYALSNNMDKARARQKTVISAMVETGVITSSEAESFR